MLQKIIRFPEYVEDVGSSFTTRILAIDQITYDIGRLLTSLEQNSTVSAGTASSAVCQSGHVTAPCLDVTLGHLQQFSRCLDAELATSSSWDDKLGWVEISKSFQAHEIQ